MTAAAADRAAVSWACPAVTIHATYGEARRHHQTRRRTSDPRPPTETDAAKTTRHAVPHLRGVATSEARPGPAYILAELISGNAESTTSIIFRSNTVKVS